MAPRKATVRALFLSLILVWIIMLITEELSTVSAIFLPLYYSLLSLKNYQLLLTIAQNEPKRLLLVFSLSFKIGKFIWITNHFQRLKFMNLLSILHVERAYELRERNFSVFFSQFAAKKEVSSTLLTWISSVLPRSIKSGNCFFKCAD